MYSFLHKKDPKLMLDAVIASNIVFLTSLSISVKLCLREEAVS